VEVGGSQSCSSGKKPSRFEAARSSRTSYSTLPPQCGWHLSEFEVYTPIYIRNGLLPYNNFKLGRSILSPSYIPILEHYKSSLDMSTESWPPQLKYVEESSCSLNTIDNHHTGSGSQNALAKSPNPIDQKYKLNSNR